MPHTTNYGIYSNAVGVLIVSFFCAAKCEKLPTFQVRAAVKRQLLVTWDCPDGMANYPTTLIYKIDYTRKSEDGRNLTKV